MIEPVTFQSASEFIKKISYKPGWEIKLLPDNLLFGTAMLAIFSTQEDSRRPGVSTTFSSSGIIYLEAIRDWNDLLLQVWIALERAEHHEMLEFFRVNGELYCDPHDKENSKYGQMLNRPNFTKPVT
jgi:hypothetical protein